jgi:hypothetical protein
MQSIANSRSKASSGDLESFAGKVSNGFQRAKDMRSICEKQLGVLKDVVTNEPISNQVKRCFEIYEYVAREGDWLEYVERIISSDVWVVNKYLLFVACTLSFCHALW